MAKIAAGSDDDLPVQCFCYSLAEIPKQPLAFHCHLPARFVFSRYGYLCYVMIMNQKKEKHVYKLDIAPKSVLTSSLVYPLRIASDIMQELLTSPK
jgi:hypothetical protein